MSLSDQHCTPCQGGVEPMAETAAREHLTALPEWELAEGGRRLRRARDFPDFARALDFVNRVGELAEREGHHPDLALGYGYVRIELYTHKIDGLHENDFILAAKIDRL
ncbi:4a-hydroxytetrahydrobiopterin dehydratase [Alkalilimnicola sp. S0819]|uniref:4a-hydroxytetrahydrobiopterin dehydratase n=1 Tax=Alkalilimnicola sp. S0819 TaxID=2613922 RepID=UPI0012615889|nr:4a-hydroxytetrahydrobiopterin dehydratase [Alkalilimnicola sp. S0819]KAB7619572.1 4a-hydroxytetrahydrobiopterin dehydratase [Alkalilimnicola sp. S0819]MPQ17624.1 4a-hydroxytetrahydrobiopterin dehydratase [Alkalilimnicola sp. S0819]